MEIENQRLTLEEWGNRLLAGELVSLSETLDFVQSLAPDVEEFSLLEVFDVLVSCTFVIRDLVKRVYGVELP